MHWSNPDAGKHLKLQPRSQRVCAEVICTAQVVETHDVVDRLLVLDQRKGRQHEDLQALSQERRFLGVYL
jgi:hypothetical protein